MRTLLAALLLLAAPGAASAGPAVALRLGYGASSGDASKGTPMSDVVQAEVPIQLDLLWRFGEHVSAGAYYAYGFGRISSGVASRCDALGASCSVWTMRAGAFFHYAFPEVSERFVPWVGAGMGWEWARDSVSSPLGSTRHDLSGWELLSLEGGADWSASRKLRIGPYAGIRWTEYKRLDGYSIVNQTFHSWTGFGLRGTYDL